MKTSKDTYTVTINADRKVAHVWPEGDFDFRAKHKVYLEAQISLDSHFLTVSGRVAPTGMHIEFGDQRSDYTEQEYLGSRIQNVYFDKITVKTSRWNPWKKAIPSYTVYRLREGPYVCEPQGDTVIEQIPRHAYRIIWH